MLEACHFSCLTEEAPLIAALNRVLSENVYAKHSLPSQLASQMDGIAVRYSDFASGMPDTSSWKVGGQYVFCNTGIAIGGAYDTVCLIEDVDIDAFDRLSIKSLPQRGQYTVPAGSHLKEGDLLAAANAPLTPTLLASLAMGGHIYAPVLKKPVVAFLPSGSELIPPGEPLPPGKNVDSNSIMMQAKLLSWGAEPLMYPITPDDFNLLRQRLGEAADQSDIVVVNAGSSKGSDDFTVEALESLGDIICHEVDHGPGKHTSYTIAKNGAPIVGLSGPPGGMESTADFYVKPLVDRFLHQPFMPPPLTEAILTQDAAMNKPVEFIMRVKAERRGTEIFATPLQTMNLRDLDQANAFLRLPPFARFQAGTRVNIELRHPYRFV
jgi:molybdopterin molybdotransferase/putative molybdopterin biosynthesis protein